MKSEFSNIERDFRRWFLYDTRTSEVLVSLPYEINPEKWAYLGDKRKIPKGKRMEWVANPKEGAKFPTIAARTLKKSFNLCGRKVEMMLAP